jgi:diguanylate cyclase
MMLPSNLRYPSLIFIPQNKMRYWFFLILLALILISTYIIYSLGDGSSTAYIHLLYIPIVLMGLMFGIKWGVLAGLIAGILVGPFLLENIALHRFQEPYPWIFRLGVFVFVGGLCGWSGKVYRKIIQTLGNFSKIHPLSGLSNFAGMEDTFKERVQQSKQLEMRCVVIQLKHLDEIKQSFGFEAMYKLVRQMGEGLKKIAALGYVGHLDTRHFVILADQKIDLAYLMDSCEEIMREVVQLQGISVFMELRYGSAQYPTDDQDWPGLCRKAFLAIEKAREQGKRFAYYLQAFEDIPRQNLQLLYDLNQTFYKNQLALFFQPQISLASGNLTGAEAIVRWNHPKMGIVPPEQFMPLAEKTLLISPLTRWTLDHAFKTVSEWNRKGFNLKLTFKLSLTSLQDPHLQETIQLFLEKHKLLSDHVQICLEDAHIHEHILDLETISKALHALHAIGISIAIDNTGYKHFSYRYLIDFPLDTLKIGNQLIQQITQDNASGRIARNTIQLGKDLGLEVVAQGVETQQQYQLLKDWGCDTIQGHIVSIPLSGESFLAWLQSKQAQV